MYEAKKQLSTNPLFSIVIPLYNSKDYIANTIQSVLLQKCQDFEIIVVNDGSTDGSNDIVKGVSDKRIILIEQKNNGVSSARNTGIKHAKGKYIAFLDSDDYWDKNHLKYAAEFFETYQEITWFASDSYIISTLNGTELITHSEKKVEVVDYFQKGFLLVNSSSVCFLRTSIIDRCFQTNISFGEDQMFWYEYALQYPKIGINSCPTVFYYQRDKSAKTEAFSTKDQDMLLNIIKESNVSNAASNKCIQKILYYYFIGAIIKRDIKLFISRMDKNKCLLRLDMHVYLYILMLITYAFREKGFNLTTKIFKGYFTKRHILKVSPKIPVKRVSCVE